MKIKSFTDVITNSSSEVFTIKTDKTAEEVLKIIQDYRDAHETSFGSGDGGRIDVLDVEDRYADFLEWEGLKDNPQSFTRFKDTTDYPESDVLTVFIDNCFGKTCEFVFDNFKILETDGGPIYGIYDPSGENIVSKTYDWGEWNKLTPLEKYGKRFIEKYGEG